MMQNANDLTAPAAALSSESHGVAVCAEAEESLPAHLIPLPGGPWSLWRWVALRGAGLPAEDILKLSEPECAAAADSLLRAEEEVRRTRDEAVEALTAEVEKADDGERRGQLQKAVSRLGKGKLPQAGLDAASARTFIDAYDAARSMLERERAAFRASFNSAMGRFARPLQEVASSRRFREALIWQNHHAYRNVVLKVLEKPPEQVKRDQRQRQCEELIANYLQRYCVKNDTIGFFGPVGWARVVPEGEALRVSAGEDFLAERNVRFEAWGVDALAERYLDGEAVIPWLKPRLAPYIRFDGEALLLPQRPPAAITPEQAAVLRLCDGFRTAGEIAAEVLRVPGIRIDSAEAIYEFLAGMRKQHIVSMSPAITVPYKLNVEQGVKELCARIGEESLRRPMLEALGEMERARDAVGAAAGDPDRLDEALGNLEATFERLTGSASRRLAGQMYAARTLIYEDCRRDAETELGPEFLQSLGPSLSLLLTSARWFTYEMAKLYRRTFESVYDELAGRLGSPVVDAAAFWLEVHGIVLDLDQSLAHQVLPGLQERWAGVLGLEPGQRRAEYTSESLREKVASAFQAPRAGWKGARYNSPDVMIAAPSAEAVRRGDYQLVLGEMHVAGITVSNWIFMAQHPSPQDLVESVDRDLPDPVVIPVLPKHQPGMTARTTLALYSPKDYFLEFALAPTDLPPGRSLSISDLVLEKLDRGLVVRTRDGRLEFDLIEFIGGALTSLAMSSVKFIKPAPHTPRVTIDRLVVHRESWSLPAAEFGFADEKDEAERFAAARRWARGHGMPRFVFVKTPIEVKPFFIDFDSPPYVNIFARAIRRMLRGMEANPALADSAKVITVSEMLPTPDQTWLPDAQGLHYTSELRIVTVEPEN